MGRKAIEEYKGCVPVKWVDVYPGCKKLISDFTLRTADLAWVTNFLTKIAQKEVFGYLMDSLVKQSGKEKYLLAVKKPATGHKLKQLAFGFYRRI